MRKSKTGKKCLSLFLTMCMLLSLFAGLAITASAEPLSTFQVGSSSGLVNLKSSVTLPAEVAQSEDFTTILSGKTSEFNSVEYAAYILPESVTVDGVQLTGAAVDGDGSASYYNKVTGKLFIKNVTGDVTISAAGVPLFRGNYNIFPECGFAPVTEGYCANIAWKVTGSSKPFTGASFAKNTAYTATITVTPDSGVTCEGMTPAGVAAGCYVWAAGFESITQSSSNPNVFTVAFPATGSEDADDLAQRLAAAIVGDERIAITNARFSNISSLYQGCEFDMEDYPDMAEYVGFDKGVILSSGNAANVLDYSTTADPRLGVYDMISNDLDSDLAAIAATGTYDTVALEFTIEDVPVSALTFNYIFTTAEMIYNSQFNDVFALFVKDGNGDFENIAFIPGYLSGATPVSVSSLRDAIATESFVQPSKYLVYNDGGADAPDTSVDNWYYYYFRDLCDATYVNGITVPFSAVANVTKGNDVTFKLVIADASDSTVDSAVIVQAESLAFAIPTPVVGGLDGDDCAVKGTNTAITLESSETGDCYIVPAGVYADKAALDAAFDITGAKVTVSAGVKSRNIDVSGFANGEYYTYFVNSDGYLSKPAVFYVSQEDTYSLTLNLNYAGADPATVDGGKITNGKFPEIVDPERSGSRAFFDGWYWDSACVNAFDPQTDRMPAGHLTLYAKWSYPAVYVNGIDISDGGYWKNGDAAEPTGSESDYNFHLDGETGTLTLNDAVITRPLGVHTYDEYWNESYTKNYGVYSDGGVVNLVLKGTSTIACKESYFEPIEPRDIVSACGVCFENCDVHAKGDGVLNVTAGDGSFETAMVVNQGNCFIEGGTLNLTGGYGGLNVYHRFANEFIDYAETIAGAGTPDDSGRIVMSGGTVNAVATEGVYSYAYACDGNFEVTGTTADFSADAGFGIYSDNGVIKIEGGHSIEDTPGFDTDQTQWRGNFFQGYGVVNCEDGVLTMVAVKRPIKWVYGEAPSDYIDSLVTVGDTITLPILTAEYIPDGKVLDGWYTEENGTGTKVTARTVFSEDMLNYGRLILYANWVIPEPDDDVIITGVPVIVDGVPFNIGTATTENSVTTVTVNQTKLQDQLNAAKETLIIPVPSGSGTNTNTTVTRLLLANIDEMADKEMTLSVKVGDVSYDMRADAINAEALLKKLGATDPERVPVNITIKKLKNSAVTLESGTLMLPPIEFTVAANYSGKSVEVETFEKYVQRVVEIPDGVDENRITTAVVIENGIQRHMPTAVFENDGKWYAKVNSLTNSTYALIYNEASFTDAAGMWYEAVVNEMASRGVINGRAAGIFEGDASITRAEFAAILVRALGLPQNGDASAFTDVSKDSWYYGAVGKAYEYKLINGKGDGVFDPETNITREEAMAMIHRAAAITELAGASGTLAAFSDADSISAWALADAQWNVGSGLIQGNSDGTICGQANITRGETATIVLRLLQSSELVDVRTKA